jgi:carboxymethylenebutenolidase
MARLVLSLLFILPLIFPSSTIAGADGMDPKNCEFNMNIPTSFTGMIMPMETKETGKFIVYMSGPMDAKKSVLMIHEWWGLNAHIKGMADQFAKIGYAAYVVDLYDGRITDNPVKAAEYMKMVDPATAMAKIKTTLAFIKKNHKKVATLGWCFGGGYSLKASLAVPVDATVIYYGELETDPKVLSKLKGPVLGVFAKQDKWITPEKVAAFETAIKTAGVKYEGKMYDADHAFANPSNVKFAQAPAKDAWSRTVKFIEKNLK